MNRSHKVVRFIKGAGLENNDQAAENVVRAFCLSWEARDMDAIIGLLSDDIVYQNVPRPAMHGIDEVARFLAPLITGTTRIEFIIRALATGADGTVLTERIDRLHYGNACVEIPLMGIFLVELGRISQWRDYADSKHVQDQFEHVRSVTQDSPLQQAGAP